MLLDEESIEGLKDTKRGRNPTVAEFGETAEENGVLDLWNKAHEEFDSLSHGTFRKRASFLYRVRLDGSLRWYLQIYPGNSSKERGLSIRIHRHHLSWYFNSISDEQLSEVCGSGPGADFYDHHRLEQLIDLLKPNVPQS